MPTLTIEYATDAERIELARAVAFVQEMRRLGATAAHGTVLDARETFWTRHNRTTRKGHPLEQHWFTRTAGDGNTVLCYTLPGGS